MAEQAECVYCTKVHEPRWLCDPAKRVLDAMIARGMSMNMPVLEFPEPIPMNQQPSLLGKVDGMLAQLVVMAATVDAAGVMRPALIFTGKDSYGKPLPRYLYPGSNADIRATAKLVADMSELAIRTAAQANRRGL